MSLTYGRALFDLYCHYSKSSDIRNRAAFRKQQLQTRSNFQLENENENESLLIPAVQHDIHHRINFKNKIDLRLT